MDQLIVGMLVGAVALGFVVGVVFLILALREIARKVNAAVLALNRAAQVFEKSADVSGAMVALTMTNRRLLTSVDSMTAAIKVFNGLVFQQQEQAPAEEPPPYPPTDYDLPHAPRRPSGRPPVPPFMDQYANLDESGVLSQTDEEMAGMEFQREAEERGEPTEEDILGMQHTEDVRGEV